MMKSKYLCFVVSLIAGAIVGVGNLSAQVISPVTFTSDSAFVAGTTKLPAGRYTIRPVEDDIGVLEVQNTSNSTSVFVEVDSMEKIQPAARTEVTFNKYGDQLVLKTVILEGETIGAEINAAYPERRHRRTAGKAAKISLKATKA